MRMGIQQTPWVDFEEGIYRYRFQGTVFAERIPLPTAMTSSDAGVSFHYNFAVELRRRPCRRLQRRELSAVGNQRPEGLRVPRHAAAVRGGQAGLPGFRAHLVYYNDALRERRRAQARHGQRDLRTQVRQRRLRLPRCRRSGAPDDRQHPGERLLDLGDAAISAGERIVVGGTDPLRPLDAQHDGRLAPASTVAGVRRRRASATSTRTGRSSASRTGFRTRATSARRFSIDYDAQSFDNITTHPKQGGVDSRAAQLLEEGSR